ncbi:glycosyltransferase [Flavobacterium sp. 83]|uniref:glycosyltransferase n=1 Tax=Flavobacterium sp. 83 TaxID=1131812 RepID=UPI0005527A7F|nr:glycosyltransferase [Flavobacterium sp. 83]
MNKVVLLIPHYNNPLGLMASVASIEASETLDILIVDDGSITERINEITTNQAFKATGKIKYIYLKKNEGIESALNHGLDYIVKTNQYHFIARLDCGDTCIGKRFEIQEKFLVENPEIKLVGSNAIAVDPKGTFLYKTLFPEKNQVIKNKMFNNAMFLHPTVMFAEEIIAIVGKYPTNYKAAEDYAFFFKIVNKFETANLPEFLLQYEINPSGISFSKRKEQVWSRIRVIKDNFYFGFWPVYGITRNLILYVLPHSIIQKIKRLKE